VSFFLSEEVPYHVETESWAQPALKGGAFWQLHPHTQPARLGLVVMAGSRVVFPGFCPEAGEKGLLVIGPALPELSPDGLDVVVRVGRHEVYRGSLMRFDPAQPWMEVELDWTEGDVVSIECGPGTDGNPCGDWLAVYELVSAKPEEIGLWRARAFREWRERNVREHFSPVAAAPAVPQKKRLLDRFRARSVSLSPPGAQRYAGDLLQKELGRPIPDFIERMRDRIKHLKKGSKLRVLSLCSGTADKETKLLRGVKGADRVVLTLIELNSDLVSRARTQLDPLCEVKTVAMDANTLDLQGERYDVILCAAGLHHLVELELVIGEIARGLVPEGEFWSITEYVGLNGARLGSEAYAIANPFFRRLPERYRVNRMWPGARVDQDLPNVDCSVGTFAAIRSQEIEGLLNRILLPHYVALQACFLWRFFAGAYIQNYNLENPEDLQTIRRAAALDAEFQRQGGHPTNLNGVYRRRL
jgi:SAM-dependent methyltransferase